MMINAIDLKEKFPHLSQAPIIEAVLDIRVVPSVKWDATNLQNELKQHLPDFPTHETIRETTFQLPPGKKAPVVEDFGCVGFKLHSSDNLHIVQFNKGSFVFSRLKPYQDWGRFSQEALQLWAIYCDLLKPSEVRRIGLRFINRIAIKQPTIELSDYYRYPPASIKELNWPLAGYLHHDVMQVPKTSYSVNVIKTVQNVPGDIGLLLDIDVFMQSRFAYNELCIIECMEEMRWVKNKIFFGSLTERIIAELK
jgi:uncharacterized protein (TIGR04255 family)